MGSRDAEPTILALPAARLVAHAAGRGLERARLLGGLDLTGPDLADDARHIAVAHLYALWERVARELDDPAAPFAIAGAVTLEDYGVLGFALLTSRTAEEALDRLLRASALINTSGRWSLRRGETSTELTWTRPAARSLGVRLANEATLALVVQHLRATGVAAPPLRVTFRHARPRRASPHADFFRCPVLFDQPADAIALSNELLTTPLRLANRRMSDYFAGQVEEELRRAAGSAGGRVRRAIADALAAGPSMRAVARQLAMSERTLRRRLDEESVRFRDLVDRVRREQAERWMRETSASIGEVAFELGFSDATAFSRAYRRWFGVSPARHRQS